MFLLLSLGVCVERVCCVCAVILPPTLNINTHKGFTSPQQFTRGFYLNSRPPFLVQFLIEGTVHVYYMFGYEAIRVFSLSLVSFVCGGGKGGMVSTLVASTRELDLLLDGGGPLHAQTKKTPQHKMGRGDRKRGGNMAGEILSMNFFPPV